jgi:hypothetical protein
MAAPPSTSDADEFHSVRESVQAFYDWYVPAVTEHPDVGWHVVLDQKVSNLSTGLLEALRADHGAQEAEPGWLVGLDFDPHPFHLRKSIRPGGVLNSQR